MTIKSLSTNMMMTFSLVCLVKCISTPAYDADLPDDQNDTEAWQICSSVPKCGMQQNKTNITSVRENSRTVKDFHEDGVYVIDVCKAILLCYLDKGNWWIHNIYTLGIPIVTLTNVCDMFETCLALFDIPISHLSVLVILEAVPLYELNMTFPILEGDTGIPYLLPNDIGDLCPYSGYCGRNASLQMSVYGLASCCQDCSCERDCGLVNNCCYSDLDIYKIFECIDTTVVATNNILQSSKYSMINRCVKVNEPADTWPCNDTIKPVSSQETHLIYVNRECAMCNGVTRFTQWEIAIFCTKTTTLTSSSHFLEHLKTTCDYKYVPLGTNMNWLKRFICEDNSVISTCLESNSNKHWETACQQLKAPYTERFSYLPKTYANIYCAMCNHNPPFLEQKCPSFISQYAGTQTSSEFFALIDMRFLDDTIIHVKGDGHSSDDKCPLFMVPYATKPGCRPLLCPEGMVRIAGLCKFFANRWVHFKSSIMVSLTPANNTTVNTTILTNLDKTQTRLVPRWITHECPFGYNLVAKLFFDIYMLSEENENGGIVHEVIVHIVTVHPEAVPEKMINQINSCLMQQWHISRDGMSYPFTAKLYAYKRFVKNYPQGENSIPTQNHIPKSVMHADNLTYSPIRPTEIDKYVDKVEIYLTKLYFCNLVELNSDEVTVYDREIVITHNGMVLGDNEYIMEKATAAATAAAADDDNNYIVKVCYEDYKVGVKLNGAESNVLRRFDVCMLIGSFLVHLFCQSVTGEYPRADP